MVNQNIQRVGLEMPKELAQKIEVVAKAKGYGSLSSFMRVAAAEKIKREESA